ncbi:MAG: family 20 glycosylhydrolase [Clostridia bacterium]|nr:family 20 glycosylhydrolase [Clostridia bacterium]
MYLQHIYPRPKRFSESESIRFVFNGAVTAKCSAALLPEQAERMSYLWHRFSRTGSVLQLESAPAEKPFLMIGRPERRPEPEDGKSYVLHADAGGVWLAASEPGGLTDGFKTLVQLICPENLTPGAEQFYILGTDIRDNPSIPFRAVHICVFPESELYNIEKAIHLAGFLKMTHLILEFWGTYRYRCMPAMAWEGHSYTGEELRPLITLARSYGMEVIPMINHFGHASQARNCYGRHTVLNREPRYALLFEPDGWTWCLSNPDTYRLLGEMRAEQNELCGKGAYFHLGFDEAYSFATCPKCRKRVPHELLAEYLNRLTEDLAADGRRPIVWGDEFMDRSDFAGKGSVLPEANGQNHGTAKAIELLDRRVIIADWEYHYKNGENLSTPYFQRHGFDVVLCPWSDPENIRSLCRNAGDMAAYGVILTTWDRLPVFQRLAVQAAAFAWNGGENEPFASTEAASILRTVYDCKGNFERSGWNMFEVQQ